MLYCNYEISLTSNHSTIQIEKLESINCLVK